VSLQIIRPGLLTSVQDLGRYGFQKYGVIVSGAMDSFALRIANLLVGNEEGEAALEITIIGPSILIEQDVVIAITGGNLSPTINGQPIPQWRPVYVKKGSTLQFGSCVSGCRAYLAAAGSFDLPKVMGSNSTYLRAGIGGLQGRALQSGDILTCKTPSKLALQRIKRFSQAIGDDLFAATDWSVSQRMLPAYRPNPVIRVIRGREFEDFTPESREQFFAGRFQVTPQSDRMGYRLAGATMQLSQPLELISAAVSAGTIQVPPEGKPIVLLADRQTTGGYPRIAQVATVDLPVIAQVKPGESIQFEEISLEEAQRQYLWREMAMMRLKQGLSMKG